MCEKKVRVLMSAYEGDEFIAEQVRSIYEQNYPGEIDLIIRDDGSTKGDIRASIYKAGLTERSDRHLSFIQGRNLGASMSFLNLIRESGDADYFFFSDQDDVWEPDKISAMVLEMDRVKGVPLLCCCGYDVRGRDMEFIAEANIPERACEYSFLKALLYNVFPGCVMGFNRKLADIMKSMDLKSCMMHDRYVFATAVSLGRVIYINRTFVHHRIHSDNVIGYGTKKIYPIKWIREKLNLIRNQEDYDLSEFAGELLKVSSSLEMELKYKEAIELLRDYKKDYRSTLLLLGKDDTKNRLSRDTLSIRCRLFFHII